MKTYYYLAILLFLFVFGCKKELEKDTLLPKANETIDCNCNGEMAFPEIKGELISFGKGNKRISLQKKATNYILEGDILLSSAQVSLLRSKYEGSGISTKGAVMNDLAKRWTGNTVFYNIDPSVTNQWRITDAITHWEANTDYNFVLRTTQANYVTFIDGTGCASNLGMIGGQQFILVDPGCSTGNMIHELGHCIGLFHEHTRMDRNQHVIIHTNNIIPNFLPQFTQYHYNYWGKDIGDFDDQSVMMYGPDFFSSNGLLTITRIDNVPFTAQRNGLSPIDIEAINYISNSTTPDALPYARIELSFVDANNADAYLAFYTSRNCTVSFVPNGSITFNYTTQVRNATYFGDYLTSVVNSSVSNSSNQSRILLGRYLVNQGSSFYNDPQWGDVEETHQMEFYTNQGTGYNNQIQIGFTTF